MVDMEVDGNGEGLPAKTDIQNRSEKVILPAKAG